MLQPFGTRINVQQLEKVQLIGVLNDFNRYSSVTSMIQHLSWPSLQLQRKITRLQTLFNYDNASRLLTIVYFISMEKSTRLCHPRCFILQNPSTLSHQQSFYSRTVKDWNNLASDITECDFFSIELQTVYGT